jgi:hypothetical protein
MAVLPQRGTASAAYRWPPWKLSLATRSPFTTTYRAYLATEGDHQGTTGKPYQVTPSDQLDRVPELLAIAAQRAALEPLLGEQRAPPGMPQDPDWIALNTIDYGLSKRFWRLAHEIARTIQ